ncbi:HAD domain-containing protein [Micromonospora sp. WMMD812]|uniref:HAD domain-containing protein n=1 Tax=Micromonospora sp. WMMD812 TaxID=3015152 RepID=UPI00248B38BD|nr:HAD domain-containing protein [Micromonospora sp. WMMD812]WBB69299.1 HAD domain-containing protein [Micromonospora sp. WMMD812]
MSAPVQLFLDVDGTLIPFGTPPAEQQTRVQVRPDDAHPLLHRVEPEHGRLLSALPCDLVWATTWMSDANDVLAPLLGLPALPVVDWPDSDEDDALHWKTRGLVEWAQGRPFVWVDDEIRPADRVWVSAHHHGPALLYRVDPCHGLTKRDFTVISNWLGHAHAPHPPPLP